MACKPHSPFGVAKPRSQWHAAHGAGVDEVRLAALCHACLHELVDLPYTGIKNQGLNKNRGREQGGLSQGWGSPGPGEKIDLNVVSAMPADVDHIQKLTDEVKH